MAQAATCAALTRRTGHPWPAAVRGSATMTQRPAPAAPSAAARPGRSHGNLIMFAIIASCAFVRIPGPGRASETFLITPLINALVFLDILVLGQFGLAIILFTLIIKMATIPFTIRQLESTRAMQAAQPPMQEIQKKYKDPKRRQEETMKLYPGARHQSARLRDAADHPVCGLFRPCTGRLRLWWRQP